MSTAAELKDRAEHFKSRIEGMHEVIVRCPTCGNTFPSDGMDHMECHLALREYLNDNLDVWYKVKGDGSYYSSRILMEYGGPTTYIDTEKGGIETFWGGKTHFELLNEETLEAIDRIMEGEYLSIIRRCV